MTNETQTDVRVRIAPSPSGYMHVGLARSAIFNYLFARHHGGKFLLRIEDTDKERSKPEYVKAILDGMEWMGMQADEEIVYQSQRSELYAAKAKEILDNGHGYRCFCTQEQLQKDREEAKKNKSSMIYNRRCLGLSQEEIDQKLADGVPHTVRLKIPDGDTTFEDLIAGSLSRNQADIEDFIIARSDGSATYNLAVVVDDHDMGLTHVIRGNDHTTNTFKQIRIYEALGYDLPEFAHVPLILRPDKRKMSKRLGDKGVTDYRNEGVLPEALFNYLCLLGWSPKTDREIYSREELVKLFDSENFNASNAVFDEEKLLAFNQSYIAEMSDHDLAVLAAPILVEAGHTTKYWLETRWAYLRKIVALFKSRMKVVSEIADLTGYFFSGEFEYDEKAAKKRFKPEAADRLRNLANRFEALPTFTHATIEQALSDCAEELGLKRADLIHPTRLAVSGRPHGPGLFEMLEVLDCSTVLDRMRRAVQFIENLQE